MLPHATHSVPPSRHYSYAPYAVARWLSSGSLCGGLLAQTIDLKPQGLAKVALHHGQAKMPSTLDPSEFECILNREQSWPLHAFIPQKVQAEAEIIFPSSSSGNDLLKNGPAVN